jgi:hypothetical protein
MDAKPTITSLVQIGRHDFLGVAALDQAGNAHLLGGVNRLTDLARDAIDHPASLAELASDRIVGPICLSDYSLLHPLQLEDPVDVTVSGTGLTHLGSAEGRDKMHKAADAGKATDSMKMFLMGEEGGKPEPGTAGVQPEWFYKGDGSILAEPDGDLAMPEFALDGGEEPEIAGIYIVGADGTPHRLGFALGNEFSDHVTERGNYLWLAHSKLRPAALGPQLLLGELPRDVRGVSRILRDGAVLWEKPFSTGEANMTHSIANLEHHHFKYAQFRRPGSLHVHFFGTATASFADGIETQPGDIFEIEADAFNLKLRNSLKRSGNDAAVKVSRL